MIITFKSKASGDVIMFRNIAKQLMEVMGKNVTDEGIVTLEQLPGAIAKLKAAVAEDKSKKEPENDDEPYGEPQAIGLSQPVSFAQRAVPLISLMEYSLKAKVPVVWGV